MIGRSIQRSSTLRSALRRNKIEFDNGNAYNKRWQWKWPQAYFTSEAIHDPTRIKTPEEHKEVPMMYNTWIQDWMRRVFPGVKMAIERRHRVYDTITSVVMPSALGLSYVFNDVAFGFQVWQWLFFFSIYVRIRDKTQDPDMKETYLREMIYTHPEISKYFKDETTHVLDYDFEFDKGFPDEAEFPEFKNKLFRLFNTDTSMCSGHFTFGDVESGATMKLDIKTMPVAGKHRFQVGEPYFFYDVVAHINVDGDYKEVVVVDRHEALKKYRPFLFMV